MNSVIVKNGGIPQAVTNAIIALDEEIKNLTAELDEIKAKLLTEMEANHITKIETDELLISYIAPTTRESIDTKALKEECPEVADAYTRFSQSRHQ